MEDESRLEEGGSQARVRQQGGLQLAGRRGRGLWKYTGLHDASRSAGKLTRSIYPFLRIVRSHSKMPFVKLVKNDAYFSRYQVKYRRRRGELRSASCSEIDRELTFGRRFLTIK